MFDDLIDPDPPEPGLDTLANVSERARRLRRRRDATRVIGLGAVAGLLVGALAFVVDGDPDERSEIAESLDAGEEAVVDLGAIVNPTTSDRRPRPTADDRRRHDRAVRRRDGPRPSLPHDDDHDDHDDHHAAPDRTSPLSRGR